MAFSDSFLSPLFLLSFRVRTCNRMEEKEEEDDAMALTAEQEGEEEVTEEKEEEEAHVYSLLIPARYNAAAAAAAAAVICQAWRKDRWKLLLSCCIFPDFLEGGGGERFPFLAPPERTFLPSSHPQMRPRPSFISSFPAPSR